MPTAHDQPGRESRPIGEDLPDGCASIKLMMLPTATTLNASRLVLEPLSIAHADEMVDVLGREELYAFTGGEPPTIEALRARYAQQATGRSPAGDTGWLNWIIRTKTSGSVVGYVQATLTREGETLTADMAWLIKPSAQRGGAATEASAAVLAWLRTQHVHVVRALIHPDHHASARVAQRLGFTITAETIGSEKVWEAATDDSSAVPSAYTANSDDNTVSVIDVATGTTSSPIPVGQAPEEVAVSPDGSTLGVVNLVDDAVSLVAVALTTAAPVVTAPTAAQFPTGHHRFPRRS